MKKHYSSFEAYRRRFASAHANKVLSKPLVTLRLPDLLAEINLNAAGFSAFALLRYVTYTGVGRMFESVAQALDKDAVYHKMFLPDFFNVDILSADDDVHIANIIGSMQSLGAEPPPSIIDFYAVTCDSCLHSTLEGAILQLNSLANKKSGDFIKAYDHTTDSIYVNPATNFIRDMDADSLMALPLTEFADENR